MVHMSFPAAEGVRITWDDIPLSVRAEIEARLGSPVVAAASQPGGFSPGLASKLRTADGQVVFVKAASPAQNPRTPCLHRREAAIVAALPPGVPVPRFHWSYDDGEWIVLAFDAIDGANPHVPWRADELARVLDAARDLAERLTPTPLDLDAAGAALRAMFGKWAVLPGSDLEARVAPMWRERVDVLVELEAGMVDAVAGTTLLHGDMRADNIVCTDDLCYFVDWSGAAVGARWVDLVLMLPCIAMQGGGDPEAIWRAHPLSSGVDDEALDALLAGMVGYLMCSALERPLPGLPTLRAFQGGQGVEAGHWLARRRGWE